MPLTSIKLNQTQKARPLQYIKEHEHILKKSPQCEYANIGALRNRQEYTHMENLWWVKDKR